MAEFILDVPRQSTRIVVQPNALDHIGMWLRELEPPVVVVCSDTQVADLYADRVTEGLRAAGLRCALHTFPPGDASKCIAELDRLYAALGNHRVARDGVVLALGGGVVSDLAGFAAATWMRGIRYVTCPTTLEADVDAAIGGKTGINLPAGKNMAGAFHHATLVAVDPKCLQSLPDRDLRAGLAESIKHALIRDAALLEWHETHADAILASDAEILTTLIERNLRIKAEVVTTDEQERGLRAILNFGHTLGHAVEKWANYELRHGEAVSLGMVGAAWISHAVGLLSADAFDRVVSVLERFGLPVTSPAALDRDAVMSLTEGDKKVAGGKRRWVLLDGIGSTTIRNDVSDEVIREAIVRIDRPAGR